jgi:hypothetical protein
MMRSLDLPIPIADQPTNAGPAAGPVDNAMAKALLTINSRGSRTWNTARD